MKNSIRKSLLYTKYKVMKWRTDYKLQMILFCCLVLLFQYTRGIYLFIRVNHLKMPLWFVNFLFEDYTIGVGTTKVILLLAAIAILANAAHMGEERLYLISRTGQSARRLGDIWHLILTTFLYVLLLFGCSILFFLPYIGYDDNWGKVIGTLSLTEAKVDYAPTFVMDAQVVQNIKPQMATLLTLLLAFLGILFLGLLIYALYMISGSSIPGMSVAMFFTLLCPIICFFDNKSFYWFSPLSWISIGKLEIARGIGYPTVSYALGMLLALNTLLIIFILVPRWKMEKGA